MRRFQTPEIRVVMLLGNYYCINQWHEKIII